MAKGTREDVRALLESDVAQESFEEELLLGKVNDELHGLLDKRQLSRGDLAKRLGVTSGRISQILSGGENVTLRTLARIGRALDARFELTTRSMVGDPDGWDALDGLDEDVVVHRCEDLQYQTLDYPHDRLVVDID